MKKKLRLNPDDRERVEAVLADIYLKAGFIRSLDSLIIAWTNFVREVETGYDLSIYDYTNDLSIREILYRVSCSISSVGQSQLREILAPTDERFLAATKPPKIPYYSNITDDAKISWLDRIPINPGPELLEDIQSNELM